MHWLTVVGARPQFIKAAAVSRAARAFGESRIYETLVHTGQHYDDEMSGAFFRELELDAPAVNLGVGSASHAQQTAAMLVGIEQCLLQRRPDLVLVYGDTNSTLAAALAASKLGVPVAHVEAGLRSFSRRMAEETNRVLTDRLSRWLFAPSRTACDNLAAEGIARGVQRVGDVMRDVLDWSLNRAPAAAELCRRYGVTTGRYALATVHRAETTDVADRLASVFAALCDIAAEMPVLLPLHPRTRGRLNAVGVVPEAVRVLPPLPHGELLRLQDNARVVLTDSGGMQKEAYWLATPCVTLRDETEWVETVEAGWNVVVGTNRERIVEAARGARSGRDVELYGDGRAADRIVDVLARPCP